MTDQRCGTCKFFVLEDCQYFKAHPEKLEPLPRWTQRAITWDIEHLLCLVEAEDGTDCPCWREKGVGDG